MAASNDAGTRWERRTAKSAEECSLCFGEIEQGEECSAWRLHPNDDYLCKRCREPQDAA